MPWPNNICLAPFGLATKLLPTFIQSWVPPPAVEVAGLSDPRIADPMNQSKKYFLIFSNILVYFLYFLHLLVFSYIFYFVPILSYIFLFSHIFLSRRPGLIHGPSGGEVFICSDLIYTPYLVNSLFLIVINSITYY